MSNNDERDMIYKSNPGRVVDAMIPPYQKKHAFQDNKKIPMPGTQSRNRAPQRLVNRNKLVFPRELTDPKIRHGALTCPKCGKVRQLNKQIDAIICVVCDLIWYRGKKYTMKEWDAKWERKLKKNLQSL